jgi:hypothetical protein
MATDEMLFHIRDSLQLVLLALIVGLGIEFVHGAGKWVGPIFISFNFGNRIKVGHAVGVDI